MGLACGLIFYLAIAATALWAVWIVIRWLFFRDVVVAGDAKLITECTTCTYSLEGLGTSPTCPECNTHHDTIYTRQAHTEWKFRSDLVRHWAVAALCCMGLWLFFAVVFPPALTSLVYLSKGVPVTERTNLLMQSRVYPWQAGEMAFTLSLTWIAACALSHRCSLRTLCLAFAISGAAALIISLLAAAFSPPWVEDWSGYFWSRGGFPAAATFGTVGGITLVACMLIDVAAHENTTTVSLLEATSPAPLATPTLTSDSAASPHTQSPHPPSPDPACSPPSVQ